MRMALLSQSANGTVESLMSDLSVAQFLYQLDSNRVAVSCDVVSRLRPIIVAHGDGFRLALVVINSRDVYKLSKMARSNRVVGIKQYD
mmetsp:Transcript_14480/g.24103  ORF Transcript_14480/g.24103 Transcript_14480/m.24103 type:complete len:88 (+) Transcript_14480:233-496(+)|eukprot:CAMPEP_0119323332 /NCGR_PEP_ID=MMETSP1333-20130426/60462_1 /TAXON_ID=418940 /ORGANISM="Scyphosphaera apsteinii, Strain RCC1455" /LENGTH=87 /DNA_ID=CAMNT_0007330747 /DNA_START=231 /DNA_END=491 /DNA_ORIENTATION=-